LSYLNNTLILVFERTDSLILFRWLHVPTELCQTGRGKTTLRTYAKNKKGLKHCDYVTRAKPLYNKC